MPSAWKIARVTPVLKAGDKTKLENYRPISIVPVISKVVEKWIASLLTDHLNSGNNPLHPMQFGFRKYHSTETAIRYFHENIKGLLDQGGYMGAVFLDLKRAFDSLNHNVLISKLSHFNFSDGALCWMRSYLSNRKQTVQIGNSMSPQLLNRGTPRLYLGSNSVQSLCKRPTYSLPRAQFPESVVSLSGFVKFVVRPSDSFHPVS